MKSDLFSQRHLGPRKPEIESMLNTIGVASLEELVARTIPASILKDHALNLPGAVDEAGYRKRIREIASKNRLPRLSEKTVSQP